MTSFLLFLGALAGIVVFALITNRLTGTKASYLDTHVLAPGETTLWQDDKADFALMPRVVRAQFWSFWRLRKHTVVWTNSRVIIAKKVLFQSRRMMTHQLFFTDAGAIDAKVLEAAQSYSGGFYGRGFQTIIAQTRTIETVNGKACVRILPSESCGAAANIREALIFSDSLNELKRVVGFGTPPLAADKV